MGYEVLTMKVYVSWGFAFCTSNVSNITLMSYEVEFNCLLLIIQFEVGLCDIYVCVCVCVCVCACIKFVKSETLLKLFCSRGEYVILWWFGCYELVLKQMGNEVLTVKVYYLEVLLFSHQVFDILHNWVMKLSLIVCCWLFNLKLDYVIYIYIYIYVCMYVYVCV